MARCNHDENLEESATSQSVLVLGSGTDRLQLANEPIGAVLANTNLLLLVIPWTGGQQQRLND